MDTDEMIETDDNNPDGQSNEPTDKPPAAEQSSPASEPDRSSTATSEDLKQSDIDFKFVFASFHDEFEADATSAADRLLTLLLDPATCEARCIAIEEACNTPAGRKWLPGGILDQTRDFVRELSWLASGRLNEAIESRKASPEVLGHLATHPDALRLARLAVLDVEEAIARMVEVHQAEAWNWLRDEVLNGNLRKHLGDSVVGKHVAVWKKEQPYAEMVIGDSPDDVRAAARERWMVSDELVAETFVDAD